jgi:cytochrome P450
VSNARTATRDVEVGGQAIHAGERLSLMWIAAHRDPATFPDPEHVVIDRGRTGNLLFGAGIHRCLGEPLAILDIRIAVEELLRETHVELATPTAPPRAVYPSNGLRHLDLRLRPITRSTR